MFGSLAADVLTAYFTELPVPEAGSKCGP